MKTGARNQLVGEVIEIKSGDLMCQVKVRIAPEVIITSVMTHDSLTELGLKTGDQAYVLIKAVNVLLATD